MPLGRGETVGTAVVRIIAEGNELPEDIREQLDDLEDDFDKSGERSGQRYQRGIRRGIQRDQPRTRQAVEGMFRVHADRMRALARETTTPFFQEIEKGIKRTHGERLGERIVNDIRRGFVQGGGYQQWGRNFDELFRQVQQSAERNTKILIQEDDKLHTTRIRNLMRSVNATKIASEQMYRNQRNALLATAAAVRDLTSSVDTGGRRASDFYTRWRRTEAVFRSATSSIDRLAPRIGRVFGRGSRNDAVNFFGGIMEGGTRLLTLFPRIAVSMSGVARTFMTSIRAGEGIRDAFIAAAGGSSRLAALFGSLGSAAASLAVALPVIALVMGTIVAAVSLLAGAITALLGSAFYAFIAAVGALGAIALPAVAGIGVLVAAIASLDDEAKAALKEAIQPLIDRMKELGKIAAEEVFKNAPEQARRLGDALGGLEPIVRGVGRAISRVGDYFLDSLESPGFTAFKREMGQFLPGAVESLGKSFVNVLGGIGGLFRGLIPFAEDFLGWLEKITGKFTDWANSAEGQNQIKQFFDDAKESAKALGDFLGQLGGLIMDAFTAGKDEGDSLFTSMADAIERFREYIADGSLEKWFKDAGDFARGLGDAIATLGQLFDVLDNKVTRLTVGVALQQIELAVGAVTAVITAFEWAVGTTFDKVGDIFQAGYDVASWFFTSVGDWFTGAKDWFTGLFDGADESLSSAGEGISSWFETFTTGISDKFTTMTTWVSEQFSMLTTKVGEALTFLGELFEPILTPIMDMFSSLGSIATSVFDGISAVATNIVLPALQNLGGYVQTGFSAAWDWGKTKMSEFGGYVQTAFTNSVNTGRSVLTTLGDYAKSAFGTAMDAGKRKVSDLGSYLGQRLSPLVDAGRSALERLGSAAQTVGGWISGLASGAFSALRGAISGIGGILDGIAGALGWVAEQARKAASALSRIKMPSLGGIGSRISGLFSARGSILAGDGLMIQARPKYAAGGLLNYQQNYRGVTAGESGREAIVPLDRPLGQVDPAVRALSAFAQGRFSGDNRKIINVGGIQVTTPSKNPETVATETVDEIAGRMV